MQLSSIPFLPESPRWLIAKGREEDAKKVILSICDAESLSTNGEAATMFSSIQLAVEVEENGKAAWKDVFSMGRLKYFRRLLLAFGVQGMQQLTGISQL